MKTTQVLFWRHPVHWGFDEHDQCQDLSQNSPPVCQILLYLASLPGNSKPKHFLLWGTHRSEFESEIED